MASQTQAAISLGPTGNLQGTYKFLCLTTGLVIKRQQFKELPMPGSVIRQLKNWERGGTMGALKLRLHRAMFLMEWGHRQTKEG